MKGFLWGLLIIIVLAAAGFGGWYFFLKKNPEGGKCRNPSLCETGLKCVNKICSSGKLGSNCVARMDCVSGLLCTKSICAQKPDYSKYFEKVVISKMKPRTKPDPNNLSITNIFSAATDAIEVDFTGVKTTTVGPFYFEFVNPVTGKIVRTTNGHMNTNFEGRDTGAGTDLSDFVPGEYDVNIYYKDEFVYSTTITVTK